MEDKKKNKVCIENRKAHYDYFIEDTVECGIELRGNEVKSIRNGCVSIKESWISIDKNQVYIKKMHITAWETANKFDVDEDRERRLLLHKSQIQLLSRDVSREGYTLIPLKVYINDRGKCKVLVGICKGKHNYDKRQSEKEKQLKREIDRAMK